MNQIIIDFANALKRQFCTHCMPAMDFEESTCGYQGACSHHQRIDEVLALYEDEQGGEVVAAAEQEAEEGAEDDTENENVAL